MNKVPPDQDPADDVDAQYRRASAVDPSRPGEAVRRAVLAHAAHHARPSPGPDPPSHRSRLGPGEILRRGGPRGCFGRSAFAAVHLGEHSVGKLLALGVAEHRGRVFKALIHEVEQRANELPSTNRGVNSARR